MGGSHVTKIGTACYIRLYLRVAQGFSANHNLTTLPEQYRPTNNAFVTAEVTNSGNTVLTHADVTSEGRVLVPRNMTAGGGILLWGAWAVES